MPEKQIFTIEEYRTIINRGQKPKKTTPKTIIPKENKYLNEIKLVLRLLGCDYDTEYRFSDRRYRFDIVLLPIGLKIAIEYNGIFSNKSRHLTVTGYSRDRTKINLATTMGWKVLEYTPLNYTQVVEDVKKLLNI